ncbi:hypothetical protein L6164_028055 [Bauhinia variegata]|uniref:Uncharacterized protein n=1 Tax=Bauhinia variegata TaxID=167791 RepID=A0ACB9LV76_BAUVA|nr:hypothetical protein L6164_028055 [Bauhinia variegata]
MAGAILSTKHEKLTSEKHHEDPSKFYYHFLYKAVLVAVFLVILPLFPSQVPEFINQSLLTRNWELLHLVFVGIAISYGLFSRRNDETEKDNSSKFDNAHSFVSRFLQVSSFFEDDAESPSESDENKVQTWNNQYYRNEPVVVVAQQHSNFDEQSSISSRMSEKPLFLPVRSLRSRVSDSDPVQSVNESISSVSLNRSSSKSGSKRLLSFSSKAKNGESEGLGSPRVEDKVKEGAVLPSPIPWRSRSGRMEMKPEADAPIQYASSPSPEESEFSYRSVKSQTLRSSQANSMFSSPKLTPPSSTSSPKEISPSPSFSSESLAKNAEDYSRKKSFYKSSPPTPPPPPPVFQKSISMNPRSDPFNDQASFDKELKRSLTSERKDSNWTNVDSGIQMKARGRVVQNVAAVTRGRDIEEEGMNAMEAEYDFMEEPERTAADYHGMSFRTDKLMGHGSVPLVSEEFVDTDEDTETEDDYVGANFIQKESGETSPNRESPKADAAPSRNVSDEGPDVDKKADEFIAKFREQIRLQRIETIKRGARSRNSSR